MKSKADVEAAERTTALEHKLQLTRDLTWERMLLHNIRNLRHENEAVSERAAVFLAQGLEKCGPRVAEKIRAKLLEDEHLAGASP